MSFEKFVDLTCTLYLQDKLWMTAINDLNLFENLLAADKSRQ